MLSHISKAITTSVCAVGNFLSAAVGNAPDDVKARRDLGLLGPNERDDAEMGIKPEKSPVVRQRHRRFD